jgi:predicted amidohydrolase
MILTAAQTKPGRADIKTNLPEHIRLTILSAEQGADLIVFPEISITYNSPATFCWPYKLHPLFLKNIYIWRG